MVLWLHALVWWVCPKGSGKGEYSEIPKLCYLRYKNNNNNKNTHKNTKQQKTR